MEQNAWQEQINPSVQLTILIRNKNGKIIKQIVKKDDPLTRWALRFLYTQIASVNHVVKAEDGAMRTIKWDTGTIRWASKIAIGMDPTPATFEDYKIYAKERETTSLTITSYAEADSSGQFDIKTDFLIEAEKTYYEFGLFGVAYDGSVWFSFCVSRDVISSGVVVPANSYLTIIYRVVLGTV